MKNEDLLSEIRDRYQYASDQWRPTRDERKIDMRYISGDPWEQDDRDAREDAGRPCINHDELGQYLNACVNNVRQNKRGIKVEPGGNGANSKTAEFRQGLIRAIEYKSQAQSTYVTAFQNQVEGSYGFIRVSRRYLPGSFDQEICIKNIPNPDAVLYDPDVKEADWSDGQYCFVLDPMTRDEFKRRWPKATCSDFTNEEIKTAPQWIGEKNVVVAEYWRVETDETAMLHQLESGETVSQLKPGQKAIRSRPNPKKSLVQYMTNGIEILEKIPQPGELLPIIPFVGLERWIDTGGGARRVLFSLIRLARDPQMSHAYLCSQQMEEAGLTPKTPYVGYVGQFETDAEAWGTATKIPHAYLQVDPEVDGATGHVLPLPRREPFTPNFQGYEIAKDSTRRAIQAAMGIAPLPTAAQRNNEKSGVALEKITDAQNLGSFHFQDNFDRALQFCGRVIDSWIEATYDTEREVAIRKPNDKHELVRINTPEPYLDPKTQQAQQYDTSQGDHDLAVSTGPSHASQRDDAAAFLDTLITNLKGLPLAPQQAAKLLALAIKMRQLGPTGDEMAHIIAPEDEGQQLPPQAQQAIQQAQEHAKALYAFVQQLQGEIQELKFKEAAKVVEGQNRITIEQMKIEAGLAEAEITTKAQDRSERQEFVADAWKQLHSQAHEAGLQASDQAHQANLQASDQQASAEQQQNDLQAQQQQQQQPSGDNE